MLGTLLADTPLKVPAEVVEFAAARARGQRLGRPPAMTEEQIRNARDLLTRPEDTVSSIARLLGVSRSTIYKYVPELTTGSRRAVEVPTTRAEIEAAE
ncbi:helix-turn-helix domain-containing protein [Actinomadura formosensis]|uniref:helix-turn-helix domain-containing protein n=1 Tax=Actinomadura formosensis TaxID=60706 RepID=UPI003D9058EA